MKKFRITNENGETLEVNAESREEIEIEELQPYRVEMTAAAYLEKTVWATSREEAGDIAVDTAWENTDEIEFDEIELDNVEIDEDAILESDETDTDEDCDEDDEDCDEDDEDNA